MAPSPGMPAFLEAAATAVASPVMLKTAEFAVKSPPHRRYSSNHSDDAEMAAGVKPPSVLLREQEN